MSINDYNPDNFDWGGDALGINVDDVGPDIIENMVAAALNAHEERYGWRYLKRSEVKEGACRLFKVKYHMPEEGKKFFTENFPGYTFVWDGALGHHDHPIAHLCTELNELEMVEPLVRENKQYIDLFGNEKRNQRYHRNAITMYTMATPKDYLRYQRVGASAMVYDKEKLTSKTGLLAGVEDICLTHSLYYLSIGEISEILAVSPKRRIRALVHRHKDTHGYLNGGEQEYWVDENLTVVQKNVNTGEKYVHQSLEAMFHQGSAKTSHGGVAWTTRAAGGDSFIIEFVGCPNEVCEEYVPLRLLQPESWVEYNYSNLSVKKFIHWTWMVASTTQGSVRIEDHDLFDRLRRYVAGKERTPRLKTETMNYARRMCNKLDIISIHGGGAADIPVASMTDYVEVAFYTDVRNELDAAISFHKDNRVIVGALNKYYSGGELPKDFTVITGLAVTTVRTFSDAAIAVISHVRDAQEVTAKDYLDVNLPDGDPARKLIEMGEPGGRIAGPWW